MKAGFSSQWYNARYNEMQRAFGGATGEQRLLLPASSAGSYPDYPDVFARELWVSRSRKIFSTMQLYVARNMASIPIPDFKGPEIDKHSAELLREFYRIRSEQGKWHTQLEQAYCDGSMLGTGYIYVGTVVDSEGYAKVEIEHIPCLHVLYDINAKTIDRAKWMAVCRYYSVDEAEALFGDQVHTKIRTLATGDGVQTEVVRVFEYQDVGLIGKEGYKVEPTRAYILDDLDGPVLERERNPYDALTIAQYYQVLASGMRRPVGRVHSMLAAQAQLNKIEDRADQEIACGGTINLYDSVLMDNSDAAKLRAGAIAPWLGIKSLSKDAPPIMRIPPSPVDGKMIEIWQAWSEEFNGVSGTTELDRGTDTGNNTLGQDQILQSRSDSAQNRDAVQLVRFYRQIVNLVMRVAKASDDCPVTLKLAGYSIAMNIPGYPESGIDNWIPDELDPLIDTQDMTPGQDAIRKQQRLAGLQLYTPYLGTLVSPEWFMKELITANGDDVDEVMSQSQSNQAANPMMGAQGPMMGQQAGMPPNALG